MASIQVDSKEQHFYPTPDPEVVVNNDLGDDRVTVIGLSGLSRSGKDTTADYLCSRYGFVRVAFADNLKTACKHIFGFSEEQLHDSDSKDAADPRWGVSPRQLFQVIGTNLFKDELATILGVERVWIRSLNIHIQQLIEKGFTRIVVSDVRFPDEAHYVLKELHGMMWRVIRPNLEARENSHSSEDVGKLPFDQMVCNCSTIQHLHGVVDNIVRQVL